MRVFLETNRLQLRQFTFDANNSGRDQAIEPYPSDLGGEAGCNSHPASLFLA